MENTFENVIPSPIANATVQKYISDGIHSHYRVKANEGYILHDSSRDWIGMDETGESVLNLGFTRGMATCGANYDFVANPRQFYAEPENEVSKKVR